MIHDKIEQILSKLKFTNHSDSKVVEFLNKQYHIILRKELDKINLNKYDIKMLTDQIQIRIDKNILC